MNFLRDIPPLRSIPYALDAALYNHVRLALLRIGTPLELELEKLGIDMVLEKACWVGYHVQQISLPLIACGRFRYQSQCAGCAGRMHHAPVPPAFMAANAEDINGHG